MKIIFRLPRVMDDKEGRERVDWPIVPRPDEHVFIELGDIKFSGFVRNVSYRETEEGFSVEVLLKRVNT